MDKTIKNTNDLTQQSYILETKVNATQSGTTSVNYTLQKEDAKQASEVYTYAYIPEKLNIQDFLTKNPPTFKYKVDHFRYILSLITEIPANNKEIRERSEFTPLNAQILQSKVRDYNLYLKYLLDNQILETDNHFIVGAKCRWYKFTDKYSSPVKVEIITNKKFKKRILEKSLFEIRMEKRYHYLYKWFNSDLSIDFDAALDYLNAQLKYDTEKAASDDDIVTAHRKFNINYLCIHKFKEQQFSFIVDENIKRLHTNLTNIKSELRNFIKYKGQSLVNVDLKNSQPLLSTAIFNADFYKKTTSTEVPKFNLYNSTDNKIIYSFNDNILNKYRISLL